MGRTPSTVDLQRQLNEHKQLLTTVVDKLNTIDKNITGFTAATEQRCKNEDGRICALETGQREGSRLTIGALGGAVLALLLAMLNWLSGNK